MSVELNDREISVINACLLEEWGYYQKEISKNGHNDIQIHLMEELEKLMAKLGKSLNEQIANKLKNNTSDNEGTTKL